MAEPWPQLTTTSSWYTLCLYYPSFLLSCGRKYALCSVQQTQTGPGAGISLGYLQKVGGYLLLYFNTQTPYVCSKPNLIKYFLPEPQKLN